MEEPDLPQDYLSPRSKIARMLANIDEASSPPTVRSTTKLPRESISEDETALTAVTHTRELSASPSLVDEDASPARPIGRTARRMMHNVQDASSDNELYDATPARRRSTMPVTHTPVSVPHSMLRSSPGLFVSPSKSSSRSDSEDDLPVNPIGTARLAALVAAKRAERLEKEKTQREMAEKQRLAQDSSDLPEHMIEDTEAPVQHDLEKLLSDAAKPTRKASKKAVLEMQRETQRIAREQALAHQMKTKKKFSTSDLFARFNFRQQNAGHAESHGSSSVPNSDGFSPAAAAREPFSTPPSSPPTTPFDTQKALVERGALARMMPAREDSINTIASLPDDDDDELPSTADIISQSMAAKASAKQIAPESPSRTAAQRFRLKIKQLPIKSHDSDEELDIIKPMPDHLKAFDRVKPVSSKGEVHSKAIHALKHLAHLNHDDTTVRGRKLKVSVAPTTVNAGLLATARAQARQAQQKRLAELQAKGVVIMSAEEQEKEADQMENLLEQARREAEALRKKERADARKDNNEVNLEASDDEVEDEDWRDSEADEDELEAEDDADDESESHELIDDLASLDDEDQPEMWQLPGQLNEQSTTIVAGHKRVRVILDDDEDDEITQYDILDEPDHQRQTQPVEEDPFAAFGFADNGPILMSPTQAFAATMRTPTQLLQDQSQSQSRPYQAPPPTFGQLPSQVQFDSQSQLVPSSQLHNETQQIDLDWETQMPETPLIENKTTLNHVETPGWEPSQDAGLPSPWTALRNVAGSSLDDRETQSTVIQRISQTPELSATRPKGRLTKGMRHAAIDKSPAPAKIVKNAFSEMQKLRLQSMNTTDRAAAEKEMKEMMDDQAEESEDEYAGLGGDDSNMIAPETEEDRAMIDESNIEIDEEEVQDMAKFYAEKQRAAEEEATSKLFKDLTTGALRRRQGVGWELDEDEDELAARRRQIRQREEARKRRLLLQDDNVKGLVDGKGDSQAREAFLRTIGDDDDDEYEELPQLVAEEETSNQGPLTEISNNKRKLDGTQVEPSQSKIRRVHEEYAFSRPTSILQIQESLSFLLDEPAHALQGPSYTEEEIVDVEYDSNDEIELEMARENDGGFAPDHVSMPPPPPPPLPTDRLPAAQRRTPARPPVIDRLSLRRGSSSSGSTSNSSWSAWSTGSGPSKAPSLLRKATSNLSASNSNDRGVSYDNKARSTTTAPAVKTGGSKKSSLAYQSRAQERKAVVERAEKKKEDGRRRIAELRRQQGGGLVGNGFRGGSWE